MNYLLSEKLTGVTASREHRTGMAHEILENPERFPELLEIAMKNNKEISHKASWVLEFVFKENPNLLYDHLDLFFENLAGVKDDSAIRPLAKICEMMCILYFKEHDVLIKNKLTDSYLEQLTEICFDWLIGDVKVATKAFSMSSLYLLGLKLDWIHPELKNILEQGFNKHSAAYKARGRHILDKIYKYNNR